MTRLRLLGAASLTIVWLVGSALTQDAPKADAPKPEAPNPVAPVATGKDKADCPACAGKAGATAENLLADTTHDCPLFPLYEIEPDVWLWYCDSCVRSESDGTCTATDVSLYAGNFDFWPYTNCAGDCEPPKEHYTGGFEGIDDGKRTRMDLAFPYVPYRVRNPDDPTKPKAYPNRVANHFDVRERLYQTKITFTEASLNGGRPRWFKLFHVHPVVRANAANRGNWNPETPENDNTTTSKRVWRIGWELDAKPSTTTYKMYPATDVKEYPRYPQGAWTGRIDGGKPYILIKAKGS